jgi:hypothetical protein
MQWDEDLITDNFSPHDVDRILQIPLNENPSEDFVAWQMTKSHSFLVRSAYYVEWNHLNGHRLTRAYGQGTAENNPVRDTHWKLKVPSKIVGS